MLFCTTPDCDQVLNTKTAVKNKVTCDKCKKSTCIKCKTEYHPFTSCDYNMKNKYNTAITGVDVHNCPKCGCQVEKNGGCA